MCIDKVKENRFSFRKSEAVVATHLPFLSHVLQAAKVWENAKKIAISNRVLTF
jgi:hypothetical protein